jgi:hypothetical protein
MARGFGILGTNEGDSIRSTLTAHSTLRTWAQRVYISGPGGASAGRLFDKNATGTNTELLACTTEVLQFQRFTSGTTGVWNYNAPPLVTWTEVILVYDAGSVANNPVVYFGEVPQTPTSTIAPTGTMVTTADAYTYGNRLVDLGRHFDGMMADVGIWDRLWSAADARAYARGFGVWHFPVGRVEAFPLVRSATSLVRSAGTLGAGTLVHPHPRVSPPRPVARGVVTAAAGGGAPTRRNLNLLGVS